MIKESGSVRPPYDPKDVVDECFVGEDRREWWDCEHVGGAVLKR